MTLKELSDTLVFLTGIEKDKVRYKTLKNPPMEKLWDLEHHGWVFVSALGDGGNTVYVYRKNRS